MVLVGTAVPRVNLQGRSLHDCTVNLVSVSRVLHTEETIASPQNSKCKLIFNVPVIPERSTVKKMCNSTSVQFRVVSTRSGKLICTPHCLLEVSHIEEALKQCKVLIVDRFLLPKFSPAGHQWCDILGFILAGSIASSSSSSTLQVFRGAVHGRV